MSVHVVSEELIHLYSVVDIMIPIPNGFLKLSNLLFLFGHQMESPPCLIFWLMEWKILFIQCEFHFLPIWFVFSFLFQKLLLVYFNFCSPPLLFLLNTHVPS